MTTNGGAPRPARSWTRLARPLGAMVLLGGVLAVPTAGAAVPPPRVLIYTAGYAYPHTDQFQNSVRVKELGDGTGTFTADISYNPADLRMDNLKNYDVLFMNNVSGYMPLTGLQRAETMRWMWCGGGFVGIHADMDANYDWAEFIEMMGGTRFSGHPHATGDGPTRFVVEKPDNPIMDAYQPYAKKGYWLDEEIYNYRIDPRGRYGNEDLQVLMSMDVATIKKTSSHPPYKALNYWGPKHPVAWVKTFRGGGRAFYTVLGHGNAWQTEEFVLMLKDAIKYVGKKRPKADCLDGAGTMPGPKAPPAPPAKPSNTPCPVPRNSMDLPRTQFSIFGGEIRQATRKLTPAGETVVMPKAAHVVGLPGEWAGNTANLGWSAQGYVLDLSKSGARTADLVLDLSWTNPNDDFGLAVASPYYYYTSDGTNGVDATTTTAGVVPAGANLMHEQVTAVGLRQCSYLRVFADTRIGGHDPATLSVKVVLHK